MAIDQSLRIALYPPRSGLPGATVAEIIALAGGGGGVTSFEGRVGIVVANAADYADVPTIFSVLQTFDAGLNVTNSLVANTLLDVIGSGLNSDGIVGVRGDSGGAVFKWDESVLTARIRQTNAAGVEEKDFITMVDNGALALFFNGVNVTQTMLASAGGLQINNLLTGGGFERGLTTSDNAQLSRFNANDAIFPATDPAGGTARNGHAILTYDDTTDENAIFEDTMNADYQTGTITANIDWVAATAIIGDVKWDVAFETIAPGGQDIDTDSFAAIQTATDNTNAISGVITRTTITFTQAQADAVAKGDAFRLKVTRDANAGGDTMVGDAQILRVTLSQ